MNDVAAPSLTVARRLRAAMRLREEKLAPILERYDAATTRHERWAAGADLMSTAVVADRDYEDAKLRAAQELADSGAA